MLKNPASVVLTSNSILNGDPAASLTRRRAQTWRSPYLSHRKPQRATPPVPSSAAALLDRTFEHPAWIIFHWTGERASRASGRFVQAWNAGAYSAERTS